MNPPPPPDPSSPPPPLPPSFGGAPPAWEPETPPVPWAPLADPQPAWPKALGITAIVFGAYGMISHAAGFASTKFLGSMTKGLPGSVGFDENVLGLMNRYMLYNGTGCLILGLLLVGGGIALLRRRPQARALLLTWAVARIMLAVATLPMMMAYTEAMMASLTVAPPARTVSPPGSPAATPVPAGAPSAPATPAPAGSVPAPVPPGAGAPRSPAPPFNVNAMAAAMSRIGAYAGLASACLAPVFALVWFNLRRVREQMATWTAKPVSHVGLAKRR
jgi:hypothetical protein